MTTNAIDDAISVAGSIPLLAERLNVWTSAVQQWLRQGWVPLMYAREIERIYGVPRDSLLHPTLYQVYYRNPKHAVLDLFDADNLNDVPLLALDGQQTAGIRQLVTEMGSQRELAEVLGVSQQAVSVWTQRGWVPRKRASKIEALFGVAKDQLLKPLKRL